MRVVLLAAAASFAALAVPATAARALNPGGSQFASAAAASVTFTRQSRPGSSRRRHRGFAARYLGDREYQGTRRAVQQATTVGPTGPDRALPRWRQHNQDCSRIWPSGGLAR